MLTERILMTACMRYLIQSGRAFGGEAEVFEAHWQLGGRAFEDEAEVWWCIQSLVVGRSSNE